MIREFAIKVLEELKGYGDRFANIGFDRKEALEMAINALEQRGCVWEIAYERGKVEVLDKIRVEIDNIEEGISSYHNDRPWVFKDEVLRVIDKYREGGENEVSDNN